jgi:hypothetical protein
MEGPYQPPMRASDADRDRVVRRLREAAADGRLSHDSFVERVDSALRARDHGALLGLVADLSPHAARTTVRSGLGALRDQLRGSAVAAIPDLPLPDRARPVLIVGRRSDSDLVLSDGTVSRVHAVLMLFGGQWLIHDRQSRNGTRVNGRRIWGSTAVHPGDRVSFGRQAFALVAPVATDLSRRP